jgi:hypothetical protein
MVEERTGGSAKNGIEGRFSKQVEAASAKDEQ